MKRSDTKTRKKRVIMTPAVGLSPAKSKAIRCAVLRVSKSDTPSSDLGKARVAFVAGEAARRKRPGIYVYLVKSSKKAKSSGRGCKTASI